jgi:hypothetical protein
MAVEWKKVAFCADKIDKATNVTAITDTGIADGEIAVFNLSNKDIRTSNVLISTDGTLAGDADTNVPTEKAVKAYADTKTTLSAVKADTDVASAISLKHAADRGGFDAHATITAGTITILDVLTGAVMATGTNSGTVFNTAIDTLTAAGGGIIYVRPGTYTGGVIIMKEGVSIIGAGTNATIFSPAGNNHVFQITSNHGHIELGNLAIYDYTAHNQTNTAAIYFDRDGTGNQVNNGMNIHDIHIYETYNGIVTDTPYAEDMLHCIFLSNFNRIIIDTLRGSYGMYLLSVYDTVLRDINGWNTINTGFYFDNGAGASGVVFDNCQWHGDSTTAFRILDSPYTDLNRCFADMVVSIGFLIGGDASGVRLNSCIAWMKTKTDTVCAYVENTVGTDTDYPISINNPMFQNAAYGVYNNSSAANCIIIGGQITDVTAAIGGTIFIAIIGVYGVTIPTYANNAAAVAGGLGVGAFYRTNADPSVVCVVI